MTYVDLKHLLADLTLGAIRDPAGAGWAALAAAYADLSTAEQPYVSTPTCLTRARELADPHGWTPDERDIQRLVARGLFAERAADQIALAALFLPHLAYFKQHAPRLLSALSTLQDPQISALVPQEVRIGAALFNAGLYFECHEWLEGVWKATQGGAKDFYHGIVQVAAAFYHYEKRNLHGSRTLLEKGLKRLSPYPARYLGMDLDAFTQELGPWAKHFLGASRPSAFPRIRLFPEALQKGARELRGGNG